jgi:hypothetical protein
MTQNPLNPVVHSEPIMWTSTLPNYNQADRERTIVADGNVRLERVPQTGTVGDWNERQPLPPHMRRFQPVVRHDGHEVFHVYTNAAAQLDTSTTYAQNELAQDRFLGWFWTGACPVALLNTGNLQKHHIVEKSLLTEQPCQPGTYGEEHDRHCPHVKLERAARQKKRAQEEIDRAAAYKDSTDKLIEAQRDNQDKLIEAIFAKKDADNTARLESENQALRDRLAELERLAETKKK